MRTYTNPSDPALSHVQLSAPLHHRSARGKTYSIHRAKGAGLSPLIAILRERQQAPEPKPQPKAKPASPLWDIASCAADIFATRVALGIGI